MDDLPSAKRPRTVVMADDDENDMMMMMSDSLAGARKTVSGLHQVIPGETVTADTGFLRGHGTYQLDNKLIASVSGVVEQVNKLVTVKSLRSRYQADVGDVVVGRITEVGSQRWRVDVNARQDAALMLTSINLPGGALRRRTAEDALHMRDFFVENDLISAEVQQFFQDGSMSLHTRSLKYGKLENGQLVTVPHVLIKRCKSHFHTFPFGVDLILGNNGYIWLAQTHVKEADDGGGTFYRDSSVAAKGVQDVPKDVREKIARARNAIMALSAKFIAIYPHTIMQTYMASEAYTVPEMLEQHVIDLITQPAAKGRA